MDTEQEKKEVCHAGSIIHALSAGADDYITKPFDMIDLVLRIEAILN